MDKWWNFGGTLVELWWNFGGIVVMFWLNRGYVGISPNKTQARYRRIQTRSSFIFSRRA